MPDPGSLDHAPHRLRVLARSRGAQRTSGGWQNPQVAMIGFRTGGAANSRKPPLVSAEANVGQRTLLQFAADAQFPLQLRRPLGGRAESVISRQARGCRETIVTADIQVFTDQGFVLWCVRRHGARLTAYFT